MNACIKCLNKHLWNSSSLYLLVEILQLVHEISSFSEVLYKRNVLENFSKFTDKLKKQSSRSALSKDVLRNLPNSQKNIFAGISFLIKLQVAEAATGGSL